MRELKTTDPNFEREIKTAIIEELDRAGEHRLDLSPLGRGSELKELELDLDAALAQFYRAHKKTALRAEPEENLVANCKQAVQEFGSILAEKDEEDTSFLMIIPKRFTARLAVKARLKGNLPCLIITVLDF